MSASISFAEADIFQTLRGLLLQMLPTGVEIVRAQVNRVPEPRTPDFIVMTQILRERLSTNVDTYSDGFPSDPGIKTALQSTKLHIQIDIHGPASADNCQIISTLFRDDFATTYFDESSIDAQALYTSDPRQMPFINAESQWENRWTMDLCLQVNQVVQVEQQFADKLVTGILDVDVVYPP